jgi:hypothetical protein
VIYNLLDRVDLRRDIRFFLSIGNKNEGDFLIEGLFIRFTNGDKTVST